MSLKMLLQFGKEMKNVMAPSWGYVVSDQRCWNQSVKSLHLFLHLCAVKHCGVEGEADDELAKSCFQVSNCFMQFPPQCLSLILRRLIQVYHNEHVQPVLNITDVYTFLSIYNFHLLINVIWRHIFCSQELHAVLSMLTYSCYSSPCLWA